MLYDQGCYGRVELSQLPDDIKDRLAALEGEWLEFDAASDTIVVRHIEPTTAPRLPTIVGELVQMLSEIPGNLHARIAGGDFFVHSEATSQFARVRVDQGGTLRVNWAHPQFSQAQKRPWGGGAETSIDTWAQRLDGSLSFQADDASAVARELQDLADEFEGLYPEGAFEARADGERVVVEMTEVNLAVQPLLERAVRHARPRTLSGRVAVSSFEESEPEQNVRFILEHGEVWVQRPLLWQEH
jgi:hypothetical protein